MNTDKLTIGKATLTIVHLAMKHKYQVPHDIWSDLGKSEIKLRRRKHDVLNVLKALNLAERRGCVLYFDPLISELVYPNQAILFDLDTGESETESVTEPFELPLVNSLSMDQMMDVDMVNQLIHCQGNPTLADYVFNND